jgi:very-short-patch-repair endonuclease/predicted transcriptional regulator of viral defense system
MEIRTERRCSQIATWPDAAIAAIAERQQTMITAAQLRALGVSTSAIQRARRRSRLHRVHHGVYSLVATRARPSLAAERAALLACGPTAVLSHRSAARLHGFRVQDIEEVQITVVGHRRSHARLIVHATNALTRADTTRVGGLPTTSVARTVIDHGATLGDRGLEHLVDEALRQTSRTKLLAAVARRSGRPGVPRLAILLDPGRPSSDTWSHREERLLALIRRGGLPAPEANVALGQFIPDLLWREQRVIVEYDSDEFHSGPGARRHDGARHNVFTAWGYRVIHITRTDLDQRPEEVLVLIATALATAHRR